MNAMQTNMEPICFQRPTIVLAILVLLLVLRRALVRDSASSSGCESASSVCPALPTTRNPVPFCTPPLGPRLQWPFAMTSSLVTSSTDRATIQGILDSAQDGQTVFLSGQFISIDEPLVINQSISLVGLNTDRRITQTTDGQPCLVVNADNVQILLINFFNDNSTSGSSCIESNAENLIVRDCKFMTRRCAIRVATPGALDVSQCTFCPYLTDPSTSLDYIVFQGGEGTSTVSNCQFIPKMDGSDIVTRIVVRELGIFTNFQIQILNCQSDFLPESAFLGVYEVEEEAVTTPKSQTVQIRNCQFGSVRNGFMFFKKALLTVANYDYLLIDTTTIGFTRPPGNVTAFAQGFIGFSDDVGPSDWTAEKPLILLVQSQFNFPIIVNPDYRNVNSTSAAFTVVMRDSLALNVANPPFLTTDFGGCDQ